MVARSTEDIRTFSLRMRLSELKETSVRFKERVVNQALGSVHNVHKESQKINVCEGLISLENILSVS
jgi:hypothetical protein